MASGSAFAKSKGSNTARPAGIVSVCRDLVLRTFFVPSEPSVDNDNAAFNTARDEMISLLTSALAPFVEGNAFDVASRLAIHFGSIQSLRAAKFDAILVAIADEPRAARALSSSRFFSLFDLGDLAC